MGGFKKCTPVIIHTRAHTHTKKLPVLGVQLQAVKTVFRISGAVQNFNPKITVEFRVKAGILWSSLHRYDRCEFYFTCLAS